MQCQRTANAQPKQYIETLSWAPTAAKTTESMKEKEIENEYEHEWHFIFTEWFFEPIEAMRELL